MTRTKYAEYKGVSKPMVSKWLSDNRLILSDCGKYIMVRESDARIKLTASLNNSFYDQKAGAERDAINERGIKELSQDVGYKQLDLETENAETLFRNARALKEKAAAMQAKADYEKSIGSLVERVEVDRDFTKIATIIRSAFERLPDFLSAELAAESDPNRIRAMLSEEIEDALKQGAKKIEGIK